MGRAIVSATRVRPPLAHLMKSERDGRLPGRHYLLSVIGFSSIPRLVTSLLSVVTFPIVVRIVGVEEYGVFVYVSAMLNLTVLLADAGVAAAAGKAIAEASSRRTPLDESAIHRVSNRATSWTAAPRHRRSSRAP